MHHAFFAGIDAADADLANVPGVKRRRMAGQTDQRFGAMTAQAGDRHAMHVAARGQRRGIEIGVRVEPQHAQFAPLLAAVAGNRADRADAQ